MNKNPRRKNLERVGANVVIQELVVYSEGIYKNVVEETIDFNVNQISKN